MNWLGIATVLFGFLAYAAGMQIARFRSVPPYIAVSFGVALSVPAILYVAYYSRLLGEPVWLYQIRTVPGSELLASPAGFLAGWLQARIIPALRLSSLGKKILIPALLVFGLSIPYMKPLLRPLPKHNIPDQWQGAACMQSTASTCGPASAATILSHFGIRTTEREVAIEAFTSYTGTENWYLARALRRRGMKTSFLLGNPMEVPLPAIAGVRLKNVGNSGHFIAVLGRDADHLIYSDPMKGVATNTLVELDRDYEFTGFFLSVQPESQPANFRTNFAVSPPSDAVLNWGCFTPPKTSSGSTTVSCWYPPRSKIPISFLISYLCVSTPVFLQIFESQTDRNT